MVYNIVMISYNAVPTQDPAFGAKAASPAQSQKQKVTYLFAVGLFAFAGVAAIAGTRHKSSGATTNLRQSKAKAATPVSCTMPEAGPVMKGYDLVAYHGLDADADGVKGTESIKALWSDEDSSQKYTFHFSTEENKELFLANPKKYLPAFGGFCSWGIAEESWWTATTLGPSANPNMWKMINGRLYFFMFRDPKMRFLGELTDDDLDASGNTKKYIEDGTTRWSSWYPDHEYTYLNTGCFWFNSDTDGKRN